jgi:hypothetical protein
MSWVLKSQTNADRYHELALVLISAAALLASLSLLAMRWSLPLLGMHSFRQTHTAITACWLMQGSPWFDYETPVLGAPWSIPYEFPFYQLLVAGLAKLSGLPLDPTGRLVSYLFLVLTIIPIRMMALGCKMDKRYIRVFATLLLTSPIYLFWGTAFLIETFVLFFCFWFLAQVELTTRSLGWTTPALSIFCGAVGAVGKITTFFPFECLAALILLNDFVKRLGRRESLLRPIINGSAIIVTPLVMFAIWSRSADEQKRMNPIAIHLISSAPSTHQVYFGTWGQLFSVRMLLTLLRTLNDTLGIIAVLILIACVLLVACYRIIDRPTSTLIVGGLSAFLLPFALFTNAHLVHNYHDTENAIFLIAVLAITITRLFSTGHRQAGWNLLAVTVASQLLWFPVFFLRDIREPFNRPLMAIAQAINTRTNRDSVVVIYGQDWSSVIPYYAQRRALMEPDHIPYEETLGRARRMLASQGGHRVEAVVRCKSPMDRFPEFNEIFANIDRKFAKRQIAGCDVYFVGSASTPQQTQYQQTSRPVVPVYFQKIKAPLGRSGQTSAGRDGKTEQRSRGD